VRRMLEGYGPGFMNVRRIVEQFGPGFMPKKRFVTTGSSPPLMIIKTINNDLMPY